MHPQLERQRRRPPGRPGRLKNLIVILLVLAGALLILFLKCGLEATNAECDEKCRELKYPVGEVVPHMKHDVCVCWPKVGQPGYVLLRRK